MVIIVAHPFFIQISKRSILLALFTLKTEEKVIADKRLGLVKVSINFGVISATLFTRLYGGINGNKTVRHPLKKTVRHQDSSVSRQIGTRTNRHRIFFQTNVKCNQHIIDLNIL